METGLSYIIDEQTHRVFSDDSDDSECQEYYEDAWIFGEEAIAAAEAAEAAAEAAADSSAGNGTEEAGVTDPNGISTECPPVSFYSITFSNFKRSQWRTWRASSGDASRSPCLPAATLPSDVVLTDSTRLRAPSVPAVRDLKMSLTTDLLIYFLCTCLYKKVAFSLISAIYYDL